MSPLDREASAPGVAVSELTYTEASRELDSIVEFFEQRDVDVDQLVARLERATAIVDELDRRIRRTRAQVEELVPRLEAVSRRTEEEREALGEAEVLGDDNDENDGGEARRRDHASTELGAGAEEDLSEEQPLF